MDEKRLERHAKFALSNNDTGVFSSSISYKMFSRSASFAKVRLKDQLCTNFQYFHTEVQRRTSKCEHAEHDNIDLCPDKFEPGKA